MHKEFAVQMLNENGKRKANELAEGFDSLLTAVERLGTGDPRCVAVAKTKLEEACFFAKKAMASDTANQQ
jgi:hypothetical protein